jgi:hypothetical protein
MKKSICVEKQGFVLVMTLVLLVISCMIIAALALLTSTNSRNLRVTTARERAFYLADSGLRMAINQLVNDEGGVISKSESQSLFSDTSMFGDGDWGFTTAIEEYTGYDSESSSSFSSSSLASMSDDEDSDSDSGGKTNRLVAVGSYDGVEQTAEVLCVDVSETSSLNFIYRLVLYSWEEGGLLQVGGTGDEADFVNGDVYVRGSIQVSGDARLRHGEMDEDDDGIIEAGEVWNDAYAVESLGPMTQEEFDEYCESVEDYEGLFYSNGEYDPGEAFVDSIGNGIWDENESFTDTNGDGMYTPGDTVVDSGNGVWEEGEAWVDDTDRYGRDNGVYDPAGGYYNEKGKWKTNYKIGKTKYYCDDWPAEVFEDVGDETYTAPEAYVDSNGVYDEGEEYLDDRNGMYDWGTMASGTITGMDYVDESLGLRNNWGGNTLIEPPDLDSMYYYLAKTESTPSGASSDWGHDIAVTASDYSSNGHVINDEDSPEHIFVRNPSTSSSSYYGGVYLRSRSYDPIYYTDKDGDSVRIDDYFLEDPTDSTYNSPSSSGEIGNAGSKTYPMYLNVQDDANEKVYYVDGNLYLHSPVGYSFCFREPGTKIVIVAKGNIIISDEFYYNADYDENLDYDDIDSTIVENPTDLLCLIAMQNDDVPDDSGNIYIGDSQFGTGGSIHAMLYADNDFIDNNIDGSGQAFISIYGNMTARGELRINRNSWDWTRLDVTLDTRLSENEISLTGLPPAPSGSMFVGNDGTPEWKIVSGSWKSDSLMSQ